MTAQSLHLHGDGQEATKDRKRGRGLITRLGGAGQTAPFPERGGVPTTLLAREGGAISQEEPTDCTTSPVG